MKARTNAEFTGRHMLLAMLAFFGVIIAVNVTMATLARSSWTGFVVRNSYVASQEFNSKVAAARGQAALGWTARVTLSGGRVTVVLADAQGLPVTSTGGIATFHRPSKEAEDLTVVLTPDGVSSLEGFLAVRDGVWVLDATIDAGMAEPWRLTRRVLVRDGELR
ncbi:MAG: FixH family protein [Rhizobiaceae bacterium]